MRRKPSKPAYHAEVRAFQKLVGKGATLTVNDAPAMVSAWSGAVAPIRQIRNLDVLVVPSWPTALATLQAGGRFFTANHSREGE